LKKYKAEEIISIFKKPESFFKKYKNYKEIEELKEYCKFFGVDIEFRPFLARGFSYYNGSVFEIWSKKLGVSICGGGSYLINKIQSTGISFGLEPLMLLEELKIEKDRFLVVSLGEDEKVINLAQKLRDENKEVSIYYGKPTKALEYANSYKISKVIFVGEKEIKSKKAKVKDMKSGKESEIKL
jgi:histidyl-tRNA synthetase